MNHHRHACDMLDLSPYKPDDANPWNRAAVGHLLRRAGFAPNEAEVQAALAEGPEQTVARLVASGPDSARHDELDLLGERLASRNDIALLRAWWVQRMMHTIRPLRARVAAFWHNHFATSNTKVNSATMMLGQLRTFERLGVGRLGDLLRAISRDPAMIVWLDGNDNVKGRPNENYARELFELFALGVGNYSEADIREAARAFTGWHQRDARFRFVEHDHDAGAKTVFGSTGTLDGDDVVDLVLEQPACGRFIALRLLREFLCPEPPQELIEALAARLRATKYDIGDALGTLLSSRAMFDPRWRHARIKSPLEYVLGMVRSLELTGPAERIGDAMSQMGQRLLEPPSVKGWDGHRAWLNSTTMLVRLNAAIAASSEAASRIASRAAASDRDSLIARCAEIAFDGEAPEPMNDAISNITGSGEALVRRTLEVMLSAPEYQLA